MPIRPHQPSFRPLVESLEQRTVPSAVVQPPRAADDAYRVTTSTRLAVPTNLGVLANDTGTKLTAVLVHAAGHGTVQLQANGSFTYTPQTGFTGTDNFTYKARAGTTDSNVATVTLNVAAPARVQGVSVDRDGSGQVTSLTVTFSEVVNFDLTTLVTSPFGLIRGSGRGLSVGLHVSYSVVNGQTVAVLALSGPQGSTVPFPHSPYTLTIMGSRVTYGIGQVLDGDGNGSQGGNFVLTLTA
jgi:hypothetical protein